jgi:hypothetical protein
MKRALSTVGAMALLPAALLAQDSVQVQKLKAAKEALAKMQDEIKFVAARSAIMGPIVKGAPYSAEEVSESNQMLTDGTRIHNQTQTTVYRDGEGRMRRETPDSITIFDPVEGVSYILDPKTMTGKKLQISLTQNFRVPAPAGAGPNQVFHYEARGEVHAGTFEAQVKPGEPGPGKRVVIVNEMGTAEAPGMIGAVTAGGPGMPMIMRKVEVSKGESETLGKQNIEGVEAEGTRVTRTIETGAIGNDRPIHIVSERWYSPELQTTVMSKNSDPRMGEDTFRLRNVRRGEPGAYLFQPPAGYQIGEPK